MAPTSDSDDGAPDVPIACVECGTESRIPLAEVGDALERHNDRFHDGADVAQVDPDIRDSLADLVAEDLGLFEDSE